MEIDPEQLARLEAAGQIVPGATVNAAALFGRPSTPAPPEEAPAGKAKRRRPKLQHNAFALTEEKFQKMVIQAAILHGWHYMHIRPGRVLRDGVEIYETAYDADASGWPDLVLVRDRTIYAELKSATGRTSAEQDQWLAWLKAAGQEVYVWQPKDWHNIVKVLSNG